MEDAEELESAVCGCVAELAGTLKPKYATIARAPSSAASAGLSISPRSFQ